MSATTMSGADKGVNASGSKQSLKSSSSGKALDTARKQTASPPVDGQNRKSQPPQQKAWTGTNPITQRASAVVRNGTEKSTSRPTSAAPPKAVTETNGDQHAHDRAVFLLANFTGHDATITLKNGEQFSGVFSGLSFDNPSKYTLKMVKRLRGPTQQQVNGASSEQASDSEYIGEGEDHVMVFDKEDTVDLSVANVVPMPTQSMQNGSISSIFRTDTEISGRDPSMPRERELQRWDAGNDDTFGDMSLDASGGTGWDQFATNERMYGVQSTYDENIYTTQIDYSDPKYKAREEQAARIAREIEGSAPANAHVAEERRQNALQGESGLDEEDKYSGVRREASSLPKRASNAYVPPSQRSITNAPTVPGAPFDPAIISSSLAKPGSSTDRGLEQPKPATSAEALKTPPTEAVAKSSGSATTQQTPAKKTENTTEDHVRGVADSFKQFANNEKLRLRLAQEQKRTAQRAEKNVKLNDLKKFAANFKLNSRIPDDLVPILAKDHDKQKEIQTKAETAWKEEEKRIKDKELEKSSVGAASPAPSASSSAAVTQSGKVEGQSTTFNRNRVSGSGRPPQPIPQMTSPRSNAAAVQNRTYGGHSGFQPRIQPLPDNIRIPTGPAHPAAPMDMGPLSPGAATRLNAGAKAFEFRPAAHAFTPTGTTPSPRREVVAEQKDFFKKKKSALAKLKEEKGVAYSPVKSAQDESPKDSKSELASRGGVPHAFRTAPTWMKENQEFVSYTKSIPQAPTPSQTHSQMHTPNPNSGQMPHAHQLPPHMQGPQATPSRGPQYLPPQHMPPNMPPHHQGQFGPGMHGFAGNGSVQSSPRFSGAQVAFSGQVPVPQFSGQQFNGQQMQQMGMQGYGMSPSMGYRSVNMPPGAQGQMMMMGPGGQGGHGQMPIPPYGRGPQQFPPNMMPGSVPMNQQGSAQGGYPMQPPMPGQHPGQQSYSPMPPHATPHMQHHQHMQQSPYAASPRPAHMMQHTTSHQGFNPQGPMGHMQGPQGAYAPSPGMQHGYPGQQGQQGQQGWHGYGMGQRQMSHGAQGPPQGPYPGMTPRQGQAVPNMPMQPSPGQGQRAEGDEGK